MSGVQRASVLLARPSSSRRFTTHEGTTTNSPRRFNGQGVWRGSDMPGKHAPQTHTSVTQNRPHRPATSPCALAAVWAGQTGEIRGDLLWIHVVNACESWLYQTSIVRHTQIPAHSGRSGRLYGGRAVPVKVLRDKREGRCLAFLRGEAQYVYCLCALPWPMQALRVRFPLALSIV